RRRFGEALPRERSAHVAVAVSRDVRRMAMGVNEVVFLWDTATGDLVSRFEGHHGLIEALAFTPDGRRLASASQDGTVLLWQVPPPAPLPVLRGLTRRDMGDLWT